MRGRILQEIAAIDSQIDSQKAAAPFERTIKHTEKAYDELSLIHEQQERYNVNWAFSHASDTVQGIVTTLFSRQLKQKISEYAGSFRNRKKKQTIEHRFSVIQRALTDRVNKTRTSPKLFRTASGIILLSELIITLLIVLTVARVSSVIDQHISIPRLSLLFVGTFGLMRVVLNKATLRFLHNWSWGLYQDAVDAAFEGIAVVMATSFVLAYHVKRGMFLESKIDTLLSRSLKRLQEPLPRYIRRERKALHRAARLKSLKQEQIQRLRYRMEYLSLQEAFELASVPGIRRSRSFRASTPLGTIHVRTPRRSAKLMPQPDQHPETADRKQNGSFDLFFDFPDETSSLPSGESLLTPEAVNLMKKRTNRVMDYLSKKFSAQAVHKQQKKRQ